MGIPYRLRNSWKAPANAFQESVSTLGSAIIADHSILRREIGKQQRALGACHQQFSTHIIDCIYR